MTSSDDLDDLPVEYLLVVTGEPATLESFAAAVSGDSDGRAFTPAKALAPPPGLSDVDLFAVPYYHIIQGEWARAADILEDLHIDDELAALLRDRSRGKEVSTWLQEHGDAKAMLGVQDVRRNLQQFGVLSANQWKRQTWGSLTDRMRSKCERVSDNRAVYRFKSGECSLDFIDALADRYALLAFGAVAVNAADETEHFVFVDLAAGKVECSTRKQDPLEPSWLEQLPEIFGHPQ